MTRNPLKTALCGREMESPVMLGSGTIGERKETVISALDSGAGAAVIRTLRVDNTKRRPFQRPYYIEPNYMLNSDNNNATNWRDWVGHVGEIEKHGRLVVSISARNPEDGKIIAGAMEKSAPSFYELNFSCSHSAKLYGRISYDDAAKSLSGIRDATKTPVFLKLSLDNIDVGRLAELEASGLVDAYVLSNTIGPGLKIDIMTRRPALDSVLGGISGPAIKPLVMAGISGLMGNTGKPVIGVGGIESASDVLEYLILGCHAVQVYTAAHRRGLGVFKEINSGIEEFIMKSGESLEEMRGSFKAGA